MKRFPLAPDDPGVTTGPEQGQPPAANPAAPRPARAGRPAARPPVPAALLVPVLAAGLGTGTVLGGLLPVGAATRAGAVLAAAALAATALVLAGRRLAVLHRGRRLPDGVGPQPAARGARPDPGRAVPAPRVAPDLVELTLTDPVTGLPNRAALARRIGAVQHTGRPHALALIGLESPAASGTAAGTAALREVTARLTRGLRGEDWLARGTDTDFVVLVEGTVADAEVVAARLVAAVGPHSTAGADPATTACAGVVELDAGVGTGEVLRRADLALRSAHAAGAGAVHRYADALRRAQDRRAALLDDLAGARERGELRLTYQPVVDAAENRTVSVEALLRWRHPLFGDVSPTEFVPLAEESPLIVDIGRWVLHQACAGVAAADGDLCVSVNVSACQVRSGELVPDVLAALERSGLPPSRLVVEITESVLLDDPHALEDLTALRRLGVRIAVDDFGTGWSSLAYLVGMPVDVLKMDQQFLAGVEHDPARRAMCRAVLSIGQNLGLPVVVEGVTTPAELHLLRDMGHRYLQGFLFSRPLEAEQLAAGAWRTAALPAAVAS